MSRYSYNIEVQKSKDSFEISLLKKGYQYSLFSVFYKKINNCDRYAFLKNDIKKKGPLSYEIIFCNYCRGKKGSFSVIKKATKGKHRVKRVIKNSKILRNEFKKSINTITSSTSKFKYKKIGNLKIYSTNESKALSIFNEVYNNLHKIR